MSSEPSIRLDPTRFGFVAAEERLRASASDDIGEALDLARTALGNLIDGAHHTSIAIPTGKPKPADLHAQAVFQLVNIGIRTARATTLLIESGWEIEAHSLMRRLMETAHRVQAILDDHSGEAARQWLGGVRTPERRLFEKYGNHRGWEVYSSGAHVDARSALMATVPPIWVDVPDEERALNDLPTRDRDHATGMLLEIAYECTLLLVGLAQSRGAGVQFAPETANRLRDARERHQARAEALSEQTIAGVRAVIARQRAQEAESR